MYFHYWHACHDPVLLILVIVFGVAVLITALRK
jgi:hypothetical protein